MLMKRRCLWTEDLTEDTPPPLELWGGRYGNWVMMIDLREKDLDQLETSLDQQILVANRYIIDKKIGKGSFGEVFKGHDKDTNLHVAIKIELSKTFHTKALVEGKILKKLQSYDGIPKLLHCGTEGDYNVLVLELLGPNLEDILNYCDHKLSLKTVIMLSDQLIQRMETIHNRGFIHRDIKSDNFLIGAGDKINKLYAIDFGLSKRYVHPHTGEHILIKKHKGLIGTARFASINAHLGLEQSRRDDLQALGYLMIYLAKGELPWQKIKAKTKQQKYKKILDMKDAYTPEALAEGLPDEFTQYLNYTKRLEFEERPDYVYMRTLFHTLIQRLSLKFDNVFDWMIPKEERDVQRRKMKRKFKTQQLNDVKNSMQATKDREEETKNGSPIADSSQIQTEQAPKSMDAMIQFKTETQCSPLLPKIAEPNTDQQNLEVQQQELQIVKLLSAISEKNDEDQQSPPHRHLSPLKLQALPKLNSEVNVNPIVAGSSSAAINRLASPSKVKRRHTNQSQIRHQRSKSSHKPHSAISELIEEPFDIEENIETSGIYTFNIQGSKLEKEKTMTPSPVKSRTILTRQLDCFQASISHLKAQMNSLEEHKDQQMGRSRAVSHEVMMRKKEKRRIVKQDQKLRDSSMQTEYDDQEDSQFCVKPSVPRREGLIHKSNNTSSEGVEDMPSGMLTRKKNIIDPVSFEEARLIHDFVQQEKQLIQQLKSSKNEEATVNGKDENSSSSSCYQEESESDEEDQNAQQQKQTCRVF